MTKVTIGIPFCNNETTLGDAVRSIFSQTFKDWELILIDDGAKDGSLEIVRSIQDQRVKVLSDDKNLGLAARLTQIADMAEGQYIARMDADDLMHPIRLERQVCWLDERPHVDLVDSGIYIINERNDPIGIRNCCSLNMTSRHCLTQGILVHPAILSRVQWMRCNRYDHSYPRAQDHELWCRSIANGNCRFGRLPEPLHFYREEGSISLNKTLTSYRCVRRTIKRYGPQLVGTVPTSLFLIQSYLKSFSWQIASLVGCTNMIVRNRRETLSADCRANAVAAIQAILETHVPGLKSRLELRSQSRKYRDACKAA